MSECDIYNIYISIRNTLSSEELKRNWDGFFGLQEEAEGNTDLENKFQLSVFYTLWSQTDSVVSLASNVNIFLSDRGPNKKSQVNCIALYFLDKFFENLIYDFDTNSTRLFKPLIVSSGPNYTPVLENFILFIKNGTRGVSNQKVELLCRENFLNYVRENGICQGRIDNPLYRCNVIGVEDVENPSVAEPYDIKLIYPTEEEGKNKIIGYIDLLNNYETFVSENLSVLKWCGCFAPGLLIKNPSEDSFVPDECNPLCINNESQKLYDENLDVIECQAAVCIIDNNAIEAVNYTGNITFSQICTGCTKNQNTSCFCIVDVTVGNVLEKIGNGSNGLRNQVDFLQVCPQSTCVTIDNNNVSYKPCNQFSAGETNLIENLSEEGKAQVQYYEKIERNKWVFIIIFIVFILLIIISDFFINPIKNK
jgi:hypothetical protein